MAERRGHVLVVDDEPDIRSLVTEILGDEGYGVDAADGAETARELRRARRPDVILLDVWMPGTDGITLLREWSGDHGLDAPVIVMSGHGTIETAVEATRLGAYDFLEKPISLAKLVLTVGRALDADRLTRENVRLRRRTETGTDLVGASAAMSELRERAARAAAHDAPILVTGESGAGKSRLARHVHAIGPRREGPFVAAPVAGLTGPEDLFGSERGGAIHYGPLERANAGAVFLKDVADMPPGMQATLAGALQNGWFHRAGGREPVKLDTRIIAASRRDLAAEVAEGRLHEGLYYLLNVVPLEAPPLREHAEDVPALVERFIDEFATSENVPFRRCGVAAKNRLRNHPWPGNVRELRNVVQRLMILGQGPDIEAHDVELGLGAAAGGAVPAEDFDLPFKEARENFERAYLGHQFDRPGASVSEIAARIGIERSHLYRKLKQLGIDRRPAGGRFTG